jgi:hypothetical protein
MVHVNRKKKKTCQTEQAGVGGATSRTIFCFNEAKIELFFFFASINQKWDLKQNWTKNLI